MSLVDLYQAVSSALSNISTFSTFTNYVNVAPIGIQYATTSAPTPTETEQLFALQAVCTFDGKRCRFIDQSRPCVITEIDGKPTIMPAKKGTTDKIFKSFNDALLYLKSKIGLYPSVTLPPPATTSVPPSTSVPPPPSTEAPLIQPWDGGGYITIEQNNPTWGELKKDETFQPIIVDQTKSNMQKLVYKMWFDNSCPLEVWDSNCGHLTNPNFIAFKNFKDAFVFIDQISPPESSSAPGGGKGRRTKKKGKKQLHQKYTRRYRRRAAN